MRVPLNDIVQYLDGYLRVAEVPDEPSALNGLQVEAAATVSRVVAAVDACQATIDEAARRGGDLLLVHHGLFWKGLEPVVGRHARRLQALLTKGISVYAAHIPLDLHPDVGNNALLAAKLGLSERAPFGDYRGHPIGVRGRLDGNRDQLVERIRTILGVEPFVIPAGDEQIRHVGVVTGAGGSMLAQARSAGLDTYVTGEGPHHLYLDAEEWRINLVFAGHYATETLGVRELAAHVAERFHIDWVFADHPTGL